MKKVLTFVLLMTLAILLCAYGIVNRNVKIEQNIVFICNGQNYSDSYYNKGYFIDNCGNKCYFDLSDESMEYANINKLYEYLNANLEKYEKQPFLKERQLHKCYKYMSAMDENAEFSKECVMVDFGEYYLYGVRLSESGEPQFILLAEYGDWMGSSTDKKTERILDILGKDTWMKLVY